MIPSLRLNSTIIIICFGFTLVGCTPQTPSTPSVVDVGTVLGANTEQTPIASTIVPGNSQLNNNTNGSTAADIPSTNDAFNTNNTTLICGEFSFSTNLNTTQITDYYKSEMLKNGRSFSNQAVDTSINNVLLTFLYFEKSGRKSVIEADENINQGGGNNPIYIAINLNNWYTSQCEYDNRPQDIPIIGDFRGRFWSNDSATTSNNGPETPQHEIDYHSTQQIDSVIAFYRSNMAAGGWELISEDCNTTCSLIYKNLGRTELYQYNDKNAKVLMENAYIRISSDSMGGTSVYIQLH